jgi:hypothetical protein
VGQVGLGSGCDFGATNLAALSSVTSLKLNNNYLSGTLPEWLSALSDLQVFCRRKTTPSSWLHIPVYSLILLFFALLLLYFSVRSSFFFSIFFCMAFLEISM